MKKYIAIFSFLSFSMSLIACQSSEKQENYKLKTISDVQIKKEKLATAYFASGCFWCVEAVFESVKGVKEAVSGYSGGEKENPTYSQISSGSLKHAEAVKVIYDPTQIDFQTLVNVFFGSHNPTTFNRQGPDVGPQYRSIAFYQTDEEKLIIENAIMELIQKVVYSKKIVTEVIAFDIFWEAEEYHQDYERRNPNVSYVRSVSVPRLVNFKNKFPELLKDSH
ncbi:MAG: peptide-methionine (S)-S-oxide reductase [Vicingaceae bacterium]|jgi:peptide-methionine (S)-S-oxide reductase